MIDCKCSTTFDLESKGLEAMHEKQEERRGFS
jgi:hypothetical protein